MNLSKVYQTNANFRMYVNHYCNTYCEGKKITVEEALTHAMVRNYAETIREGTNEEEI